MNINYDEMDVKHYIFKSHVLNWIIKNKKKSRTKNEISGCESQNKMYQYYNFLSGNTFYGWS